MHWILYFSNLLNLYPLAKHIASHVMQVSVVGWSMGSQYQGWSTRERFKKFFHFIEERRVWISRPQINEFTGNVGWFSNRFLLLIPNYIKSWIKLKIVQNHINVLLTMSAIHITRGMSIMYHLGVSELNIIPISIRITFHDSLPDWLIVFHNRMTSLNGNIFLVTGLLCREFTWHRGILFTEANDADLWCFL